MVFLGVLSIKALAEYGSDDVGYTFYTLKDGSSPSTVDSGKELKVVVTGISPKKTVSIGQVNSGIKFGTEGVYTIPSSITLDDGHVYLVTGLLKDAFKYNSDLEKVIAQ